MRRPLGALVTHDAAGAPVVDHLPFIVEAPSAEYPHGALLTHAARANAHWQNSSSSMALVMAVFQSSDAYISPSYYASYSPGSAHVPTYYYVAVHAHGVLHRFDDHDALRASLAAQSAEFEREFNEPWTLEDADPVYRERLLSAIVGLRLVLSKPLVGKFKLGQDRAPDDRRSVREALASHAPDARHVTSYLDELAIHDEDI